MLTIVTINRNDADGLDRTLRSVASQTAVGKVQSIIVDGASTDRSPAVIATYAPRLSSVVVTEPDRGIYDAMNKGLARATGDYTLWLNAGDYFVDDAVVADFLDHEASRTGTRPVVMGNLVEESHGMTPDQLAPYTFGRHLLGLSMHRHPASFVPTDLARAVGGYSEDYGFAGDYDFMLRVAFAVGVEEWHRTCTVFTAGGTSHQNAWRTPAALARVRRDRLEPTRSLRVALRLYDLVFQAHYRHRLRGRGIRG